MSNRFDVIPQQQGYVSSAIPLPLELMMKAGAMKQAEQDKAQEEKLMFLGKQVNALSPDIETVKSEKAKLDNELNTYWADKDFTDPNVKAEWARRKRELANEYGPQGKLGAIESNYNAYKEYEKHIIDKAKDLGWSENYLRQHLNDTRNKFQGTLDSNNPNYYRSIQTPGLAKYVNTTEWFDKAVKNIAADTNTFGLSKAYSPNEVTDIFKHGKVEHKDYDKIVNALSTLAQGDTELLNSLKQEGEFRGINNNEQFILGYDKKGKAILNPNSTFTKTLIGGSYGAQYRKEDIDYMQVKDPIKLYDYKQTKEEENRQKLFQFGQGVKPADPDEAKQAKDDVVTADLKNFTDDKGAPMFTSWSMKNGKLIRDNNQDAYTVTINGKEVNIDNLPKGYEIMGEGVGLSAVIKTPDNKTLSTHKFKDTKEAQKNDYLEVFKMAKRLGMDIYKDKNLEHAKSYVEKYLNKTSDMNLNYTKYDEGLINALNNAYLPKLDKEDNIIDDGKSSIVTIKNLDGTPINQEGNISNLNAQIMKGGSFVGGAKNLTNMNYQSGDMLFQGRDPKTGNLKTYLVNTNDINFNAANQASDFLTKSLHKYVTTGKKSIPSEKELVNHLNNNTNFRQKIKDPATVARNIIGVVTDTKGNRYYSYIPNKDNDNVVIVFKEDIQGNIIGSMSLATANSELDTDYIPKTIGTYNTSNYNRTSKNDAYGTYDLTDEDIQNLEE